MKAESRKQKAESRGQESVVSDQWSVISNQAVHGSRITHHAPLRTSGGFTLIEIAVSLAIIGFALIAIIGVLPIGMGVQTQNREETIINQEASVWLDALRNGAQGLDDLTNYVFAITNEVTPYYNGSPKPVSPPTRYWYTPTASSVSPQFPLINGARIVGLLSTPKYIPTLFGRQQGFLSNNVVAYVRSMSGAAYEKFPQNNPSVKDLAFSYRMTSEVIPYAANYSYDSTWLADPNYVAVVNTLSNNLHDVRLIFRWPLRSNGQLGLGGQAFRTIAGGYLLETNETPLFVRPDPPKLIPSPYDLYFFQPRNYVKAQ
jgi:type II secretory pathway pseudopilin PulG